MSETFRVTFVCTGNRFRSPLAAAIFEAEIEPLRAPVEVQSFGLLDLRGIPALDEALDLGEQFDVDLSAHRSRVIQRGLLEQADLVVGFERIHLAAAVVDGGAGRDAVYTLPELVALLDGVAREIEDPVAGARALLAGVSRKRHVDRLFTDVPELADPLGRPRRVQEEIASRVSQLTRTLARRMFGLPRYA